MKVLLICMMFQAAFVVGCTRSPEVQTHRYSAVLDAWKQDKLLPFDELVNTYEQECFATAQTEDAKIPAHTGMQGARVLRIHSVNVHCCMGLRRPVDRNDLSGFEAMCDVIKKINADVLCVQELSNGVMAGTDMTFIEYIQKELGYPYVHFAQSWRYRSGPFGNAIFSRVPFKDVCGDLYQEAQEIFKEKQVNFSEDCNKHELFTTEGRSWVRALLEMSGNTIIVYTTHLDTWDKTTARRDTEMQELAALVQKDQEAGYKNIIVAADFNSVLIDNYPPEIVEAITFGMTKGKVCEPLSAHVYDHIKKIGLRDSFALSRQDAPLQTAWTPIRIDACMIDEKCSLSHKSYVHSNIGNTKAGAPVVATDHKSLVLDIQL